MNHRSSLLSLAVVGLCTAVAQTPFEYADQRTHNTHYTDIIDQAVGWTVCGHAGMENGVYDYGFVTHFGALGDILWTTNVDAFTGPNGFPSSLAKAGTDHVLATGMVDGCDTGPFDQSFLMSIAIDGSIEWQQVYGVNGTHDIAVSPNGLIALLGYDATLIASAYGDSLTSWSNGATDRIQLQWEGDTALLVSSSAMVERRSASGLLLGSADLLPGTVSMLRTDSNVLALAQTGSLLVLEQNLSSFDTLDLGTEFPNGALIQDGVYVWAVGGDHAARLDPALDEGPIVALDPGNEFPDPFFTAHALDGQGYFGTTATLFFNSRTTGILRTVGTSGDHVLHPINVSATIASIDSAWFTGTDVPYFPHASVSVRIANQGTETVQRLFLNTRYNYGICSAPGITGIYDGLDLLPGEDTVITGIHPFLLYGTLSVLHQEFCIAALSPNDLYDRDMSDNLACDTLHLILGVNELMNAGLGISIPNPFTDHLDLHFPFPTSEELRVRMFDTSGRSITEALVPKSVTSFSLQTGSIADGAFLFRIEGTRSSFTRALVHTAP